MSDESTNGDEILTEEWFHSRTETEDEERALAMTKWACRLHVVLASVQHLSHHPIELPISDVLS